MESLNAVTLAGKLTDDAVTGRGGSCEFVVRTYRVVKGEDGEKHKIPEDHFVVFPKPGSIFKYLIGGKFVIVQGRTVPESANCESHIRAAAVTFTS